MKDYISKSRLTDKQTAVSPIADRTVVDSERARGLVDVSRILGRGVNSANISYF